MKMMNLQLEKKGIISIELSRKITIALDNEEVIGLFLVFLKMVNCN